jgi:hypothetical protein
MKTNLLSIALAVSFALGQTAPAAGDKEYKPVIRPADFTNQVTNPYFPLTPGTVTIFSETEGSEVRQNKVTVTSDSKMVMGVKCVVVHDRVTLGDKIVEDTFDWYAQDKEGAVWYFGEDTKEYKPGGVVNTAGSWEGGVNGQPGIAMPAKPVPGAPYRQEYSADNAEDMGQIVAVGERVTVPAGTYENCLKTKDWSMLESGNEHKIYAKGIGVVRTQSTGGEITELLSRTTK